MTLLLQRSFLKTNCHIRHNAPMETLFKLGSHGFLEQLCFFLRNNFGLSCTTQRAKTPQVTTPLKHCPTKVEGCPPTKLVSPLSFEFKEFPRLVFVVSPLKFLLPRQNYASSIKDDINLKFHFLVMIFPIPAENVFFHNFPAVLGVGQNLDEPSFRQL